MIGVEIRGGDVGGLVRYLYGPGDEERNVHEDPHLVAAWREDLDGLEPKTTQSGRLDFRPLIQRLKTPHEMMTTPQQRYVLHIPLSSAPEDRVLTDGEWADVARTTVKQLGLGEVNDPDGCRWIAVRHHERHVHLVVTLARQNGKRADPHLSKKRIGEACRMVEDRYGLRRTGRRDSTAAPRPTRGEVEKAKRLELIDDNKTENPLNPKIHLRETVQRIAARSGSTEEFLRNLRAHEYATRNEPNAFLVAERLSEVNQGQVTGYAVGLKNFTHRSQTWEPKPGAGPEPTPIFYGGSRLDRSLSLPRLEAAHGWRSVTPSEPEPVPTDEPKTLHKIQGSEAAPMGERDPKQSLGCGDCASMPPARVARRPSTSPSWGSTGSR